jgi:hypothetical protein
MSINLNIQFSRIYTYLICVQTASEVMDLCVESIRDPNGTVPQLVKVFALNAFHNILSLRAGRLEYLNTNSIHEIGDERQKAVERYLYGRLSIFAGCVSSYLFFH